MPFVNGYSAKFRFTLWFSIFKNDSKNTDFIRNLKLKTSAELPKVFLNFNFPNK